MIALPVRTAAVDVVLAPHLLYPNHMRALRRLVEAAVRVATPRWEMRNLSTHVFSLRNGERQSRAAFEHVVCIRPAAVAPVTITDASIAADYVASVADHYQDETTRPWHVVTREVRLEVQREIDTHGAFVVAGESGAFVCR